MLINARDTRQLTALLDDLILPVSVAYAAIYDANGLLMVRQNRPGKPTVELPPFTKLRRTPASGQPERITLGPDAEQRDSDWFRAMLEGGRQSHLTIPMSATGTMPNDAFPSSGSATGKPALAGAPATSIGYVHVAIDEQALMAGVRQQLGYYAWLGALLLLFIALFSPLIIRWILAPLSRLKILASEIAASSDYQPMAEPITGEMADISNTLDAAWQRDNDATLEQESALSLRKSYEERAAQLERENDELKGAISEAAASKQQLRQLAYYDGLTSLPNRRLFTEQLERFLHLAQRNGEQLALLFLDLDNFKQVNDAFGHYVGDELLQAIVSRLQSCLRESDLVGLNAEPGSRLDLSRFGGDEFAVVLNQIDGAKSAGIVAQRIIKALQEPISIIDTEVTVSVSVGISIAPGDASDSAGLVKAADTALYYAKKGGKADFCYYQNNMDDPRTDQIRLKVDLRNAAERDQLELHYQPQIDIRYGTVVGAEALLRWNHPEQGLIPPLQFIPLAEEMDIIGELGKWALQKACRQLQEFDKQGIKLPRVTVNVSALQFNEEFIDTVQQVLRDSTVDPSRLQLELTEGAVVSDIGSAVTALDKLKEIGVCLSFDDFGSGFSPLSYLSRFPLDELKIDRHFVIKSQVSESDANLVAGFIALARCLNMRLVASGVESREQFQFLSSKEAHILQGYLFSAPVTADKLGPLLAPWYFLEQVTEMFREFDDA